MFTPVTISKTAGSEVMLFHCSMNWGIFAAAPVETEGDEKIFAFAENFDICRFLEWCWNYLKRSLHTLNLVTRRSFCSCRA